jgi:hypothetical protein
MAEQATSPQSGANSPGDPELASVRAELDRNREEVLRLRDLLVGKDAELGTLRGRLAEIEAGAAPLLSISARLRSLRSPRAVLALIVRRVGRG